jgi:RHS repeat-associated protein
MFNICAAASGGMDNRKKYNGIEFDNDLDINTYEAFFRNLDPQIGRWWQIDPKCEPSLDKDESSLESFSPYNSMSNNPIRLSDPLGDKPLNEYTVYMKNGEVTGTVLTGTKGGNKTDYVTFVDVDRAPYADGVTKTEMSVTTTPTTGPSNYFEEQQKKTPTPGFREFHGFSTEMWAAEKLLFRKSGGGAAPSAVLGAAVKKYTISQVKEALVEVYKKLKIDSGLPKMDPGKKGSPQRGNSSKGYRLDNQGHPKTTNPNETGPHINFWDYVNGKRKSGDGIKDAVPIK